MSAEQAQAAHDNTLFHVLLALAAVIVTGRLLGWLFARVGQPPVIGEVVAGILLGPSLLGRVAPAAADFILPAQAAPLLGIIAQLGVILYLFLVGLELDGTRLLRQARATVVIAHSGMVLPFLLGAALALAIYPALAPAGVRFTSFALFLGISLAVTAFPVLARILSDRGMTRTDLGVLALGSAAVSDMTAWCVLAVVVGVARAKLEEALWVSLLAIGFLLAMFFVVRPIASYLARKYEHRVDRNVVAATLLALLLSALVADAIGIHALFGAFLLGAAIPHDSALARVLTRRMEDLVTILFLPAFFAITGMRTQISLVATWNDWLLCGAIILIATLGKFGGTLLAARACGFDWRTSSALGALMNTRGLMELVVLNIGLDLGIISPTLFAVMVIMALVTTLATTPLLHYLQPRAISFSLEPTAT
jgi:Kef-type K+ transport system membrane component KefB